MNSITILLIPPSGYDETDTSGDKYHAEYISKRNYILI